MASRRIPQTLALSVLAGCSAMPSGSDGGRDSGQVDSGMPTPGDGGSQNPYDCGRDGGGIPCAAPCEIDYGYRIEYLDDGGTRPFCESFDAGFVVSCQCFV